jgi:hypothetical protein
VKKRILITYDVEDWAYHKNAKILRNELSRDFEIDLISDQDKYALVNHLRKNSYDLLFLQWFPDAELFTMNVHLPYPVVTQVTSNIYFKKRSEGWRGLQNTPLIASKSREYYDCLLPIFGEQRVRLAYHVNDVSLFEPRFGRRNKDFVVGYVGRDCEVANEKKGHSFIKEACEKLGLKMKIAGFDGRIPYHRMHEFYQTVDVVVCASADFTEGAPNPMLEGGLSGTPLITTRVGQIQEMLVDGENGFFCDRNADSIAEKISILQRDNQLYDRFSKSMRDTCVKYSELAISQWRDFFHESVAVNK